MPLQIAASVGRVLRRIVATPTREEVHFHIDAEGRPFVCDYRRCESPGITSDELF